MTGATQQAVPGRCALMLCVAVAACSSTPTVPPAAPSTGQRPPPAERGFRASDLAKSDVDAAAEVNLRESLASARLIMDKLYRRNPQEWRKGGYAGQEAAVARAFDAHAEFRSSRTTRATASSRSVSGWRAWC